MTNASPKKPKLGRRENSGYQENIRIDALPESVAKAIMQKSQSSKRVWPAVSCIGDDV